MNQDLGFLKVAAVVVVAFLCAAFGLAYLLGQAIGAAMTVLFGGH